MSVCVTAGAPALLREPAGASPPASSPRVTADHEVETGAYGWYACAACVEHLAREDWVLESSSAAPLVFANPHGRFFELLLVTHVIGGVFERQSTTEFTWFAEYAWRVAGCARCLAHIGWHFEATRSDASLREFVALSRAAVKFLPGE